MAIEYDPIQCRSCLRVLAEVSATGLAPFTSDAQGCDTCHQFGAYHDAVQTAERAWAELEPKRDSSKARQIARLNHMRIHMEFDNWLIGVEASQRREPQEHGSYVDHTLREEHNVRTLDQRHQQGTKRAFSDSPTAPYADDHVLSHDVRSKGEREQQRMPLSSPITSTKSRKTSLMPSCKRLKFSDSVEFRDDYRDSSEYLRTDEKYVRGRYACPGDSEYLDTSGSAQTFLKFTGVKRVKGDWVEVTEAGTASKRQGRQAASEGTQDDAGMLAGPAGDVPHKINEEEGAPPDHRALRLVRRTRSSSGTSVSQRKGSAGHMRDPLHQNAAMIPLSRSLESLGEPSRDVGARSPAPQSDEKHLDMTGEGSDHIHESQSKEHFARPDATTSKRGDTGMITDEQTPRTREGYHKPSKGHQSLVVPHRSGTSDGYAGVAARDQQCTFGAKAAQHMIAQQALGDEASHVQTEPLTRIGEVPTSLRVRHSVPCPGCTSLTESQAEQANAAHPPEVCMANMNIATKGSNGNLQELGTKSYRVSEAGQKRVLDGTEGIADPQSPPKTTLHHSMPF